MKSSGLLSAVRISFFVTLTMRQPDSATDLVVESPLGILEWLKDPRRHFPPQVDGDLVKDGVCGLLIARKLKITQSSASEHLNILADAGLIRAKRIKQWTFYQRDEKALRGEKEMLARV
jgi:ArsR family transcriptional regulator